MYEALKRVGTLRPELVGTQARDYVYVLSLDSGEEIGRVVYNKAEQTVLLVGDDGDDTVRFALRLKLKGDLAEDFMRNVRKGIRLRWSQEQIPD